LSKQIKEPRSAAERMRAYRRRRRHGFRCVEVQVGRAELDGLVANGYLPSDKVHDIHAIQIAVNDLLFDWLQQT
jgi:hypothetical protein